MDITWFGHSCFRISERGKPAVITDPYSNSIGLPEAKLKADIVTVSHDKPGHNAVDQVSGYGYALNGPGEYEVGGVFITGIAMHYIDEESGEARPNVAYKIEQGSLVVLHLGDLAHIPNQATIEKLGEVHVLLIPVGGGNGLRASQATELISLIEPGYIVPMHYALPELDMELDSLDKFLKAMGISNVQEEETLKVSVASIPEQPQVIRLIPQI